MHNDAHHDLHKGLRRQIANVPGDAEKFWERSGSLFDSVIEEDLDAFGQANDAEKHDMYEGRLRAMIFLAVERALLTAK